MQVKKFTFNPFQENTYILYDDSKECVIIDPGCYEVHEKEELVNFIKSEGLTPVKLLNTHCHIDHILGNNLVAGKYGLKLEAHKDEIPVLKGAPIWAQQYGIIGDPSPEIEIFLEEGDKVTFGNGVELEVLFVPGHAPGHIAFVNHTTKEVFGGDVLFEGSFGRIDLPGGDLHTLIESITKKLFTLPDDYKVYAGHMGETTIGVEKQTNMILSYINQING